MEQKGVVQLVGVVVSFWGISIDIRILLRFILFFSTANKKDTVIPSDARRTLTESDTACVLGNLRLAIGDSLNQSDEQVTCKCLTPPVVNCVQEEYIYDD